MPRVISVLCLVLLCCGLTACANFTPQFDKPSIKVKSFRVLPSNSLNPTFAIGLEVSNPNGVDLNIKGMSYTASIAGKELLSGVANQLPVIPAYGQENINLQAQADWLVGVQLLSKLMSHPDTPLTYNLNVKMDVGLFSLPIYIERKGVIDLTPN